eukprot:4401557-Amphidinium_carterae.1
MPAMAANTRMAKRFSVAFSRALGADQSVSQHSSIGRKTQWAQVRRWLCHCWLLEAHFSQATAPWSTRAASASHCSRYV